MNNFIFWRNWQASYKFLYFLSLIILILSTIAYSYYYMLGSEAVIAWVWDGELDIVKTVLDRFSKNFFEFTVEADSYLLIETFKPTGILINYDAHYLYLIVLCIGVNLMLTSISDLRTIWYAIGLALLAILWGTMSFELLRIFKNIHDKFFLILVIGTFSITSFIFHSFIKGVNYLIRFSIYTLITIGFAYIISEFAEIEQPFMHLSTYSIAVPIVISIIFILLNAHEFIRVFVYIATNPGFNQGNQGWRRFLFITLVYLANLIYVYLHLTKNIDLDIYFLSPFVLFIGTTFFGIWGFQQRENQYKDYFDFQPTGAFLYLGMAIVTMASITFAFANDNNPLIEVYEDSIMYSHIGFGISFLLYVFGNFKEIMMAGKPVYKILYIPKTIDFMYNLFIGMLIVGALLFNNNFFTYKQAFAGYFNGLGDLHIALKDNYLGKQYYNLATGFDSRNHRSYYSLGALAMEENNEAAAQIFFEESISKNPSPFAYAQLAEIQLKDKDFLRAIVTLQKGIEKCPDSGELYNNLALLVNDKNMLPDSVLVYFDQSRNLAKYPQIPESNSFSLWTKYDIYSSLDSIYQDWTPQPYIGTKSNELVFLNAFEQKTSQTLDLSYLKDSVLGTPELCYIYNYALNQRKEGDTTVIRKLKEFAKVQENFQFLEFLNFALANIYYYQGKFGNALELMTNIYKSSSRTNAHYANMLGMWLLEMEDYQSAADYFRIAVRRGKEGAKLNYAIALSELPDKAKAIATWQELREEKPGEYGLVATDMLNYLVPDSINSLKLMEASTSDLVKYRYLHYNQSNISNEEFDKIYSQIENNDIRVIIGAERIHTYLDAGDEANAGVYMKKITSEDLNDQIMSHFQLSFLRYVHFQGKTDQEFLEKVENTSFGKPQAGLKSFYKASYFAKQGETEKAGSFFQNAIEEHPFKTEFYLKAANFFKENDQPEKAYELLLKGVENNDLNAGILKAYILTSIEMRYDEFAKIALEEQFKLLVSEEEYQEFLPVYNKKLKEIASQPEDWDL
ncbi:tetratricopeptide repeat protein [Flexithrix dorotheae]|uniref:tetratricopeptide repeat protein n=1 Tax=Flexithrix dorotheae TaxID=70993 RepID=UPI00036E6933|nr:tetratricopeptide repeat protein [Flexithrix dorotheae]